jgi:iron(III) transport system permease protein
MPFTFYRFLVIALTALAVMAPLSLVFYQSFLTAPFFDPGAALSLDGYAFVFSDDDFWDALRTTFLVAGGMAAIAVPFGAVLAFLMVRTDVPGRVWLEPLILVPIFVSAVVIAFGYVVALGPVGIFSTGIKSLIGFTPWNLYSLASLIVIAGLTHVPHVYLYAGAGLRGLGTDLEEAARVAGANPLRSPSTSACRWSCRRFCSPACSCSFSASSCSACRSCSATRRACWCCRPISTS